MVPHKAVKHEVSTAGLGLRVQSPLEVTFLLNLFRSNTIPAERIELRKTRLYSSRFDP